MTIEVPYKKKSSPVLDLDIDEQTLLEFNRRKIPDNELDKYFRVRKTGDNEGDFQKPYYQQITLFALQKTLYNITGSYNDEDLTRREQDMILDYCRTTLTHYFSGNELKSS